MEVKEVKDSLEGIKEITREVGKETENSKEKLYLQLPKIYYIGNHQRKKKTKKMNAQDKIKTMMDIAQTQKIKRIR